MPLPRGALSGAVTDGDGNLGRMPRHGCRCSGLAHVDRSGRHLPAGRPPRRDLHGQRRGGRLPDGADDDDFVGPEMVLDVELTLIDVECGDVDGALVDFLRSQDVTLQQVVLELVDLSGYTFSGGQRRGWRLDHPGGVRRPGGGGRRQRHRAGLDRDLGE